jgi:MFS family permease
MKIKKLLDRNQNLFIAWCLVASFGTYFCMYAFRKPFNAGLYSGLFLGGFGYKSVLIISQVLGYTFSKFFGIKVISELKAGARVRLIIMLIFFAEGALFLFGLVPHPYNFVFLFLNGLPLGMVYGVVFSFLEGRRFTEMIAMGISISVIAASGILKTTYFEVREILPSVTEFWMPFIIGLIFLPLFLLFVWMLSVIPAPTKEDQRLRSERKPMSANDKREALREFGFPIFCFVAVYTLLTMCRDFRDNFTVEIWNEIDADWTSSRLARTELISGFMILIFIGGASLFKSNVKGFRYISGIIILGLLISGIVTLLFKAGIMDGYYWMLWIGIGMFLSYISIQTTVFERMIALYKIKANAGFFVYICDSIGYLASVGLLLYKEFFMSNNKWSDVLIRLNLLVAVSGILLMAAAGYFFWKHKARSK